MEDLETLEGLLELQKAVRRECWLLSFEPAGCVFDSATAFKVLRGFDFGELRGLVDFYFGCKLPFPDAMIGSFDEEHYGMVIRKLGGVEEVNRFLYLEETPEILSLLARFVRNYNLAGDGGIGLEMKIIDGGVREKGLKLFLEEKGFSMEMLQEILFTEKADILGISRGQRSADIARDEKERNFTRVHNYERMAARSVARAKEDFAHKCLSEFPESGYYFDIPKRFQLDFLDALKKAYMTKAVGMRKPLNEVYIGFDLELYLGMAGLSSNGDNSINKFYEERLRACESELEFAGLAESMRERVIMELYKPKMRAVFISGNNLGIENWGGVSDLKKRFYLGKEAWRRRLRRGELKGIKAARGEYIVKPKAGIWRVNPVSVDEFKSGYSYDERLFIAKSLEHLSRIVHEPCYTLPAAAELNGMPSLDSLRAYVKRDSIGYFALIAGMGKRRVLTGRDISQVRRGI